MSTLRPQGPRVMAATFCTVLVVLFIIALISSEQKSFLPEKKNLNVFSIIKISDYIMMCIHNGLQYKTMEKYRKWTDETAGINPFIKPSQPSRGFFNLLLRTTLGLIKLSILLFFLPLICSSYLIDTFLPMKWLHTFTAIPQKLFLTLLGLWGSQDQSFQNLMSKNNKGKLILSNSTCILEGLYYFTNAFPAKFIILSANEERCTIVTGLPMLIRIFTQKQPFFNPKNSGEDLKSAIRRQLTANNNCILFYEGIRTNGAATIKISSKLSDQLYSLEQDYTMVHCKYQGSEEIFSVVSSPLFLIVRCLCEWRLDLKIRLREETMRSIHSSKEIQRGFDEFLLANASKLLDTDPCEYYNFLEFYERNRK